LKRSLKKLLNLLKRFLTAKKRIGRLPHADIAIFDTHTADHLSKVLSGYTIFTIDTRGESIHLRILLISLLEYLYLRGKKRLSILYYWKIIKRLAAKICITNQDANALFFDLARENDGVRFIALQQGLKQEATISAFTSICGDYYAYGNAYAEKLKNGEVTMVVAGSLKANNAQYERGRHPRVAYISSFVGHALNTKVLNTFNYAELSYPSIYGAVRIVDGFCVKNDIELVVVSKSLREQTESERAFIMESELRLYSNVLGRTAKVIAENSYVTAGESQLIVCDQSALGYELLGGGCKVVFLNFTSYYAHAPSYRFGWPLTLPDRGPFWCCIPDPAYIDEMLQKVWRMSQDEWGEISRPYRDELMHYDKGNSILHRQLKAILHGSEDSVSAAS
jgi:surface carbohydrate biosynthesis protein